jgi:putative tricarboxylic transport membrane protein
MSQFAQFQPLQCAIAIAVLAIAALCGAGIPNFPAETGYAGVGPRFYPGVITTLLVVIGLLLLWQATTGGFRDRDDDGAAERDWPGAAWVAAGLLLHAALITKIGFVLSATLLFVAVARGFGSRKPLRDAIAGVAITWPVFLLFTRVLNVSLPAIWQPWI